ncbi:beta-1,3-galactosyltransferase 1-like [Lytechinus pictus]|uniref:beta-1,3-galactosyltransferase 1-like n=1 Tax=Lytechinus pictus TaxID=7653 RepID=UPI0030B9F153
MTVLTLKTRVIIKALFSLCTVYLIYRIIYEFCIWGRYGSDFLSNIVISSHEIKKDRFEFLSKAKGADWPQHVKSIYDGNSPAINPHPYKFIINEPNKCRNEDGSIKEVFLLVLVTSIHKNTALRRTDRETWASQSEIEGKSIITLFLLANPSKGGTHHQVSVDKESALHHDIIMGDFQDSYKNLTLKTVMGMKWVSQFCPHVRYVLKTDDDMIVMYENLVRYLSSPAVPPKNFVSGIVVRAEPVRNEISKWYVPENIYPQAWYPPFCSGSGYVMSGDVARNVYEVSTHTPYLYLEDVFMGFCLFQLGVYPLASSQFHNNRVDYSTCVYRRLFTTHYSKAAIAVRENLWRQVMKDKQTHCYLYFL